MLKFAVFKDVVSIEQLSLEFCLETDGLPQTLRHRVYDLGYSGNLCFSLYRSIYKFFDFFLQSAPPTDCLHLQQYRSYCVAKIFVFHLFFVSLK
jgi:hypothetical protein